MKIDENTNVIELEEKPQMGNGLINGGFFIFNKEVFKFLNNDENCDFEFGPFYKNIKARKFKSPSS